MQGTRPITHKLPDPVILLICVLAFAVVTADLAQAQLDLGGGDTQQEILTAGPFQSLDRAQPGDTVWLAVRLDLASGWHVNSARPLQDYLIPTRLDLHPPASFKSGEIIYPQGREIPLLGDKMSVYSTGATIRVPLQVGTSRSGPQEITGILRYQGCNDKSCVAPVDLPLKWSLVIASERGPLLHPEVFAPVLGGKPAPNVAVSTKPERTESSNELERLISQYGGWGYVLAFLLAFGTGLLLSFSPCTYPMIPITVSIFAGQARGMGRGFVLSLFYVLTMAVVYGVMGMIVATAGGVFGAWLAQPVVVGVIVAIFVVFALSMFGLYELQVPLALRNKIAGSGRGTGIGGAIILGAVAALVVSPCVGPFVAGIMLYVATAGSAFLGFSILFTFALGLGTLFILIGTFSSAIQALPHAGVWMESVKRFFGFILLLMALYFLRTLISTELLAVLTGLLLLVQGVYGGGLDRLTAESTFFPRLKKTIGIISFILGVYLIGGYLVSSGFVWPPIQWQGIPSYAGTVQSGKIPWTTDLDQGLQSARAAGRPVLIDTWATWCANCRKLDKATWSDDRVAAEARRFLPLKLQLERSDDPQTRHFLQVFELKQYSLPTIILLDSRGQVREVIQGYVGPEEMLQHLRAIG